MPKATRKGAMSVRALVDRINKDQVERLQFLLDPSEYLAKVGIIPSTKAKRELQILIREFLKKYPEIALLPTGLHGTGGEGDRGHEGMNII
jgi:hypothetical protein